MGAGQNDGGVNWVHAPVNDPRPEARIGGSDVPVPKVDPKDPDTIYVASVVTWKSTDACKTWYGLRGAPGGDDYQNVFVNLNNTKVIALASDQISSYLSRQLSMMRDIDCDFLSIAPC